MLELVVKAETQPVEQMLGDTDGKSLKESLLCSDHYDARLVNPEVVSLVQGVKMLDLGVEPASLSPLRFLPILDQGSDFGMDWTVLLLVEPGLELQEGYLVPFHDLQAVVILVKLED